LFYKTQEMKFNTAIMLLLLVIQMFSLSFGMEMSGEEPVDYGAILSAGKTAAGVAVTIGRTVLSPFVNMAKTYGQGKLGKKGVRDLEKISGKVYQTGKVLKDMRTATTGRNVLFLPFYYALTCYTSLTFAASLYLFFPFSLRHVKVLLISMACIYLYMKFYTYDNPTETFLAIENGMWCIIVPLVFAGMVLFLGATMKLLNFIIIFGAPALVAIWITVKGRTDWLESPSTAPEGSKIESGHDYIGSSGVQGQKGVDPTDVRRTEVDKSDYIPVGEGAFSEDD